MAFVRVTIDLENALRKTAVSSGYPERDARTVPLRKITDYLRSRGTFDPETADSINRIWNVRNMVIVDQSSEPTGWRFQSRTQNGIP